MERKESTRMQRQCDDEERENCWSLHQRQDGTNNVFQVRDLFVKLTLMTSVSILAMAYQPIPSMAYEDDFGVSDSDVQGIGAVTQSRLGQSIRGAVIGGAQIADSLDLQWERFSDRLRDEQKCDPRTNRRMFDNGTRRDGSKIGNPVLGALCTPEPLLPLDPDAARFVMKLAEDTMIEDMSLSIDRQQLREKQDMVATKVGPAFDRAAIKSSTSNENKSTYNDDDDDDDNEKSMTINQQMVFNRDLYIQMRTYGESIPTKSSNYRKFEREWGKRLLATLAPNANRNDYSSPFPKPDPTDEQPYDEASLLDALGGVSVALNKLQGAGLIGHWEISIPEDDYWNVVTIAIDDDISIGGQILARESSQRQPQLSGSIAVALVRSAMEDQATISYKMDCFFIDPTTTKQELYNPTQLLISLSDLGQ